MFGVPIDPTTYYLTGCMYRPLETYRGVVAVTDLVGVYFDTAQRASVELPDFVRERAKEFLIESTAGRS